jgi:hypothetical protein
VIRGEKVFFLHLPLATKLGTFHWPPSLEHSIGHQALDLPSPPFPFSLKGGLRSLGGLSFLGHNSQFNIEKTYSYELLRRKRMINLGSWEKEGKYNGNLVIILKGWK